MKQFIALIYLKLVNNKKILLMVALLFIVVIVGLILTFFYLNNQSKGTQSDNIISEEIDNTEISKEIPGAESDNAVTNEKNEEKNEETKPTNPPSTPVPTTTSQKLKVIEVRYFPKGESNVLYHPNTLSQNLKKLIDQASSGQVTVETTKVYNINSARPNPDNDWYSTYIKIIKDNDLCNQIRNQGIDQVWLWVDPRSGYDTGPGMEYVISSKYFVKNVQYATTPIIPFCEGNPGFVFMGFDYSRSADMALHSIGHYMEGMLGNLQGTNLFWYQFSGIDSAGYQHEERCGNVHFPPNGQADYDYSNKTNINNSCENWNPTQSGQKSTYNCTKWGCSHEGFLIWWMKRMPVSKSSLVYDSKKIPPWWDFVVDMDRKIANYNSNPEYYMNKAFINSNSGPLSCSCTGSDYKGNPVSINTCGGSVVGSDSACYICTTGGWKVAGNFVCN